MKSTHVLKDRIRREIKKRTPPPLTTFHFVMLKPDDPPPAPREDGQFGFIFRLNPQPSDEG